MEEKYKNQLKEHLNEIRSLGKAEVINSNAIDSLFEQLHELERLLDAKIKILNDSICELDTIQVLEDKLRFVNKPEGW
jgi:glutathionyl-hydroquinone reductase